MENRRLQRTRIYRPGRVYVLGSAVHDCTVHNATGLGICIELSFQAENLPDTLDFSFDNFRTIHSCKIVWRDSNLAGLAFQEPQQPPMSSEGGRET